MGRVVDADLGRMGDEGEGERDVTRGVVDEESSGRGKKKDSNKISSEGVVFERRGTC